MSNPVFVVKYNVLENYSVVKVSESSDEQLVLSNLAEWQAHAICAILNGGY